MQKRFSRWMFVGAALSAGLAFGQDGATIKPADVLRIEVRRENDFTGSRAVGANAFAYRWRAKYRRPA
jgi:hypothetical protein